MSNLLPIPPLSEWPMSLVYRYWERAAICEHDAKMTREEAEAFALQDTWEHR